MQQAAVGLHGDAPRIIGDYEIELIYSGLLDGNTDSKKATTEKDPEVAKPESTKSASRSAMSPAERHDIFRSSDESDHPSRRRSRSLDRDRGGGLGHQNDDEMTQ